MKETSQLHNRVRESATLKMTRLARELGAQGHSVISLSIGEPDFNTPDAVKDAVVDALQNNITKYPPVNGFPALRLAITQKLERENGVQFHPDQIVVSTGAKQCLINIILAVVNPDDEVILPAPFWVSYPEMVNVAGAQTVEIPTSIEDGFKVSAEVLKSRITEKTRLVILSSPSNPTGAMYTPEEMKAIADVIEQHPRVLLISDEIYEYITYEKPFTSFGVFQNIQDQLIIVNGVSKGYSMTGFRLGFSASPLWIAKALTKIQGQFTSGASTLSQMAAQKAYELGKDHVHYMVEEFKTRRDLVVRELKTIAGIECLVPDGAFYVYPNVEGLLGKEFGGSKIETDEELCTYLLEKAHVSVVPGSAFGTPGYIRISYAADTTTLKEALKRIKTALA